MNSGSTSHQQRSHTETGPPFKVTSERPEKLGIDLAVSVSIPQIQKHSRLSSAAVVIGALSVNGCLLLYEKFASFSFKIDS